MMGRAESASVARQGCRLDLESPSFGRIYDLFLSLVRCGVPRTMGPSCCSAALVGMHTDRQSYITASHGASCTVNSSNCTMLVAIVN